MTDIRWHVPRSKTTGERYAEPGWPKDWPIPRIGDQVVNQDNVSFLVNSIEWYPYGEDASDPYVIVRVLSP